MEGIDKILAPFIKKRTLERLEIKLRKAEPIIHSIYFDTSHKDTIYRFTYFTQRTIKIPSWFDRVIGSIQRYSGALIQRHYFLPSFNITPFPTLYVIGSLESINVACQVISLIIFYVNRNSSAVSKRYAQKSKLERQSIRRGIKKEYYRKYILNGHQVRGIYKKILVKQVIILFRELLKDRKEKSFEADRLIKKKLLILNSSQNRYSEWQKHIPSKNFF